MTHGSLVIAFFAQGPEIKIKTSGWDAMRDLVVASSVPIYGRAHVLEPGVVWTRETKQ